MAMNRVKWEVKYKTKRDRAKGMARVGEGKGREGAVGYI